MTVLLPSMTSSEFVTVSGSQDRIVAHPDSVPKDVSQRSSKKRNHRRSNLQNPIDQPLIETNTSMSGILSNWKPIQEPIYSEICSRRKNGNGDKIVFRNHGTRLNYRHTFEQDGSLRQSHEINFPCFVILRGYKKRGDN